MANTLKIIFHDGNWNRATTNGHVNLISDNFAQVVFDNTGKILKAHVSGNNYQFLAEGVVHYAPIFFAHAYTILYHDGNWKLASTDNAALISDAYAQVVIAKDKTVKRYYAGDPIFPLNGLIEFFGGIL